MRARASERYLVSEFDFNLNQECSGVRMALAHLFFSTTSVVSSNKCPNCCLTHGCIPMLSDREGCEFSDLVLLL